MVYLASIRIIASILVQQARVGIVHAGVHVCYNDALACIAIITPDLISSNVPDAPWDTREGCGLCDDNLFIHPRGLGLGVQCNMSNICAQSEGVVHPDVHVAADLAHEGVIAASRLGLNRVRGDWIVL